jgi:hypothetical protein
VFSSVFDWLGGSKRRWKVGIGIDPKEMEWEAVDWMHMAEFINKWQAVVNTAVPFRILYIL